MRLWSIHPRYLDATGLVALWREGLLARAVLCGQTVGYRHHPQLTRFRACGEPVEAIDCYLGAVLCEAQRRGYHFDGSKIGVVNPDLHLEVCVGQLAWEFAHLRSKLTHRAPHLCGAMEAEGAIEAHPLFCITQGGVEIWERGV